MNISSRQSGFTAIELLITLFVAAAFLIASYQLFNVVVKDGGQARSESRASNIAYDYMRRYSTSATDPCSPSTPITDVPITVDGLSNVTVSIAVTCLASMSTSLSKIEAVVKYNTPQETIRYSSYANGTGAPAVGVTDGLISWWKLNGDANTSIGSANGVNTNVTPTIGQNNAEGSAMAFNGSNAFLRFSNSSLPNVMDSITVSFWAKPASASTSAVIYTNPTDTANLIQIHLPYTGNIMYWDFGNLNTTGRLSLAFNPAWFNTWSLYTFTASPTTGMKIYRNGSQIASSAVSSTFTKGTKMLDIGFLYANGTYWPGSLDDFRIYNRALLASEVTTLYSGGAQ